MLLSVFDQVGREIRGKTMLQKIVFILRHEFPRARELASLSYTKYYYGPFSRVLEDIVEDAQLRGLIRVKEISLDDDVVRYDIAVTDKGRAYTKALPQDRVKLAKRMAVRARELNSKSLKDVISEAYRMA